MESMGDKIVFRTTVEALVQRTLRSRGRLTPKTVAHLKSLGVDPEAPRDVTKAVWEQLLVMAAEALTPGLPKERQLRVLGEALLRDWNETLAGKVLFATIRVIGVRRGLHRMTTNFRSSNSYTVATATDVGPNDVELWVSDVNGAPTYIEGLLTAAIELAGGEQPVVMVSSTEGDSAIYRIRWS
jgi:uncharacterized protein (TIGR02265 family)